MTEDPFSAPASAPGINKIPFLVFDAILVITAVALAFTSEGPLSPMLFFWILLCVIAGGLVGCLPFWIEFRDRVRLSEYEIRERQNNLHDSQWQYVDARLVEQNEFLQKLHLRLSDGTDRLAALEARPPTPTADEIAVLCGSALQKQWPAWREELLSVLSRRTDVLFNEQNAQSVKLSAAHENRLADLRKEFGSVQTVLRGLETRLGEVSLLAAAGAATAAATATGTLAVTEHKAQDAEDAKAALIGADARDGLAIEAESADTDETLDADESLGDAEDELFNADVLEAQDFDDDGDDFVDESEDLNNVDDAEDAFVDAFDADEIDFDADESEEDFDDDGVQSAGGAEFGEDVNDQTEAADTALIAEGEPLGASDASTPVQPESSVVENAEPSPVAEAQTPPPAVAPEQPALLETPAAPEKPKKATGADKTTLVAQVLIGIGNKPYVRGIGPGLSLQKGVPMQFVEIGKWEWVCPSSTVPVKIEIYKNDEIPSSLGQIELEPGQRRAVTPVFPK